ncbi:MAG: TonB-dependent receptor, partial [Saprospiraceae bacterium]
TTLEVSAEGGSFGYNRQAVRAGRQRGATAYELRVARQATDGYRDHSALERVTAQASLRQRLGERRELELHALYTDLTYQLPGGLNPEQLAENPRQARPGSARTQAAINYQNLLLGGTHRTVGRRLVHTVSGYASGFYFDHPFNIDYKRETNLAAGGRTVLDWQAAPAGRPLLLSVGAEYQTQFRFGQNFGNETGEPTELNFSDEIGSSQYLVFGQAVQRLGERWRLTAGASLNRLTYKVDRTFDAAGNTGRTRSDFRPEVVPRVALAYLPGNATWYASVSRGFSSPTLDEFRTNEGSLNTDLEAETGTNFELGYRAAHGDGRLQTELIGYYFRLEQSISSFADSAGRQLFRNAGAVDQFGIEATLAYRIIARPTAWLTSLDARAAYTYQNFTYADFVRAGTEVSGNRLPGSPPHTATLTLDAATRPGWYARAYWNYTDAIPLNDEGSVRAKAFHLVRFRLGREFMFGRRRLDVYAGVNNLLDERMSFGNDLNPQFGRRYFQPAPGRNYVVGMRLAL